MGRVYDIGLHLWREARVFYRKRMSLNFIFTIGYSQSILASKSLDFASLLLFGTYSILKFSKRDMKNIIFRKLINNLKMTSNLKHLLYTNYRACLAAIPKLRCSSFLALIFKVMSYF